MAEWVQLSNSRLNLEDIAGTDVSFPDDVWTVNIKFVNGDVLILQGEDARTVQHAVSHHIQQIQK